MSEATFPVDSLLSRLPDDLLLEILVRTGPVDTFPLALAKVRLTGSVDPLWARPLLHLASRCPALCQRVIRHVRSLRIPLEPSMDMLSILPLLSRLEQLDSRNIRFPDVDFEAAGLTSLSLCVDNKQPIVWLPRLTALEELDLYVSPPKPLELPGASDQTAFQICMPSIDCELPRLRWLSVHGARVDSLDLLAPSLKSLDAALERGHLSSLPTSLTELRLQDPGFMLHGHDEDLASLTRLAELRALSLPRSGYAYYTLQNVFSVLQRLTWLRIADIRAVPQEVIATLDRARPDLAVSIGRIEYAGSPQTNLGLLLRHVVEVDSIHPMFSSHVAWHELTRLTRVGLIEHANGLGRRWFQALRHLTALESVGLKVNKDVSPRVAAMTQCTGLTLLGDRRGKFSTPDLGHFTQLRELCTSGQGLSSDALAALPSSLTLLRTVHKSQGTGPVPPLAQAIQHLTALEDLDLQLDLLADWDLSPLQRLTALGLSLPRSSGRALRMGPMTRLQSLTLHNCALDDALLELAAGFAGLRALRLTDDYNSISTSVTAAGLACLGTLKLLDKLELPVNVTRNCRAGVLALLDHLPLLAPGPRGFLVRIALGQDELESESQMDSASEEELWPEPEEEDELEEISVGSESENGEE